MNKTYLLLGSNMEKPKKQLHTAISHIGQSIGKVVRRSAIYETAAWGKTDQPDFLNQVIIVETKLSPAQTMQSILEIEKEMGRLRKEKNGPRVIDIDILFYNKAVLSGQGLTIPHPAIQLRRFVLVPLNELSPLFIHPVLHQTIHRLLLQCPDHLDVKKN